MVRDRKYGSDEEHPRICFGVTVESQRPDYVYSLHFNVTGDELTSEGPSTNYPSSFFFPFFFSTLANPLKSGMITVHNLMLNYIFHQELGSEQYNLYPILTSMKQESFMNDFIEYYLGGPIDIFCMLPLVLGYLRQTSSMLEEKEKKIKETMKIMGMSNMNYYLTWFIRYFFGYLIIHILLVLVITTTFRDISYFAILLMFTMFSVVLILQSFFIQIFFTRAKVGLLFAMLFYFFQYFVSYIFKSTPNPTPGLGVAVSFSPHAAISLGLKEIVYCQSIHRPLGFANAAQVLNGMSLQVTLISLAIHIVVWGVLCLYLQQVVPNQWGSKKHPLFFLKCFSKPEARNFGNSSYVPAAEQQEQVEQRFKEMEKINKTIKLRDVCKQWDNGRQAVNHLNLNIYYDQIFVLLGHNGAGKTTTISMLTGLIEPSVGSIKTMGYDMLADIEEVRKFMGVCPQVNTLYDDLTVREHLELFATFKGHPQNLIDEQVNTLIADVNLTQKSEYLSKNLSGGQKRRLQVAMAFIGGSKVVFLDEPTSGMDTKARRYIWKMIKNYKSDRIIILTTHFMDEADYLADRVGIMSDGEMVCVGSPMFLKNKSGLGYNLTIVKTSLQVPSDKIISFVKMRAPSSTVSSNVSLQLTLKLPLHNLDKFEKLFNDLDLKKSQLGIDSYGLSVTTLEEVFLQTAATRGQHVALSSQKYIQNARKAELPQSVNQKIEQSKKELEGNFWRHFVATLIKRIKVSKRDPKTLVFEFVLPILLICIGMLMLSLVEVKDLPSVPMDETVFLTEPRPMTIPVAGNETVTRIKNFAQHFTEDYSSTFIAKYFQNKDVVEFDSKTLFPQKSSNLKGGVYFLKPIATNYLYYLLLNTQSSASPFVLTTAVSQAFINSMQLPEDHITIKVWNRPFKLTYQQSQMSGELVGILAAMCFTIAYAFKFSSIMHFIVKEKVDRCKHQQIISGMNLNAYWLSNFVFDMLTYLVLAAISILICKIAKVNTLIQGEALAATWYVFILYGLANLPFTYVASFVFNDHGVAQATYYFFNFFAGGIIPSIIVVMRFTGGSGGKGSKLLNWFLRVIPAFSFGEALLNQGSISKLSQVQNGGSPLSVFDVNVTLAQILYMLNETFIYWFLLLMIENLLNSQSFMRRFSNEGRMNVNGNKTDCDDDVKREIQAALAAEPYQHSILTKHLRKVYMLDSQRAKVAIDDLSFSVDKGDVFGLLGVNGAGKTTLFKMLAGQITSTGGDAYFNGVKISDNLRLVRKNLGYCPQFDALLDNLTVREQLELFYEMKGLPKDLKQMLVDQKIKEMDLQRYQHILSGTLSGGNKRKLSVACGIIGNPSIVFLDEPSTGMDPAARRFMWKVISFIATERHHSTIILTTHSMEEAEALSTKMVIMVKGNFRCIGTPQHIKSKYGEGYELEVKVTVPTEKEIHDRISGSGQNIDTVINNDSLSHTLKKLTQTPEDIEQGITPEGSGNYIRTLLTHSNQLDIKTLVEYILIEERGRMVYKFIEQRLAAESVGCSIVEHFQSFYRFKLNKTNIPLGKIFGQFQKFKNGLYIQQYSIRQTSIEQIFNRFAEMYDEDDQS